MRQGSGQKYSQLCKFSKLKASPFSLLKVHASVKHILFELARTLTLPMKKLLLTLEFSFPSHLSMCPTPLHCLEQLFVKTLDSSTNVLSPTESHGCSSQDTFEPKNNRPNSMDFHQVTFLTQQKCNKFWCCFKEFCVSNSEAILIFHFLWCSGCWLTLFLWLLWSEDGYCHSKHCDSQ